METTNQKPPVPSRSGWWIIGLAIVGGLAGLILGSIFLNIFLGIMLIIPGVSVLGGIGAMIEGPKGALRGAIVGFLAACLLFGSTFFLVEIPPEAKDGWMEYFFPLAIIWSIIGGMLGSFAEITAVAMHLNERIDRGIKGFIKGSIQGIFVTVILFLFFGSIHGLIILTTGKEVEPPKLLASLAFFGILLIVFCGVTNGLNQATGVKNPYLNFWGRFGLSKKKWIGAFLNITIWSLFGAWYASMEYGSNTWLVGAVAGLIWGAFFTFLMNIKALAYFFDLERTEKEKNP